MTLLLLLTACGTPDGVALDRADTGRPVDSDTDTDVDDTDDTDTVDTDTADTADTDTSPPEPSPALRFSGPRPTNVLLISIDTTRRDQLGIYAGLDTTPNLDRVLSDGLVLDAHRSCANWTAPSMLCVLTGRSPLDSDYWPTGVYDAYGDARVPGIPFGQPTLASLLAAQGYATGLVTANPVLSANNTGAIIEGYDDVELWGWYSVRDVAPAGERLVERLAATGQPWYAHVHFIDPHGSYAAPREYSYELDTIDPDYEFPWDVTDAYQVYTLMASWGSLSPDERAIAREYLLAVYRGELRYWDEYFGTFWSRLDSAGLLDDTLVVFVSDHGEQFGEHLGFQHGKMLFPEENATLAAFWARDLEAGRWTGGTTHQDLSPTVLDALGIEPNPEHTGTIVGLAEDRPRFPFCYLPGYCDPMMSVVTDTHQLVYFFDGRRYLYDLRVDPSATDNLWSEGEPDSEALWGLLRPEVDAVQARWDFMVPTY